LQGLGQSTGPKDVGDGAPGTGDAALGTEARTRHTAAGCAPDRGAATRASSSCAARRRPASVPKRAVKCGGRWGWLGDSEHAGKASRGRGAGAAAKRRLPRQESWWESTVRSPRHGPDGGGERRARRSRGARAPNIRRTEGDHGGCVRAQRVHTNPARSARREPCRVERTIRAASAHRWDERSEGETGGSAPRGGQVQTSHVRTSGHDGDRASPKGPEPENEGEEKWRGQAELP